MGTLPWLVVTACALRWPKAFKFVEIGVFKGDGAAGIEAWWRSFRILQDSQLAATSRVETEVSQVTQTARGSSKKAIRGWSGAERRKASVVPFSGSERRKAA